MDLNALNVFVTLFKSGSTQKAARKLNRSQSFVSKTLAQLRDELDDPLFIRTSNGLQPTTYAIRIAPKIQSALEQITTALEPESFDPQKLQYITIHVAEPLLLLMGKQLINRIRQETDAVIELRQWRKESNNQLIDGTVDIGLHVLKDRNQQVYQKKIGTAIAQVYGNCEGEYVKLLVDDYNEHLNLYRAIIKDTTATILVDNYAVQTQLMDDHYTYRLQMPSEPTDKDIGVDVALLCHSTRRHEPKIIWLFNLCQSIAQEALTN